MQDPFDPFVEWLAFPPGQPPANYYELLGLACFETDAGAIVRAADGIISRVRGIRPGPHLAEWQRLLDELTQAKACLLDPNSKAAYDAALGAPRPQVAQPAPGAPAAAPLVIPGFVPPAGLEVPRAEAPPEPFSLRQTGAGVPAEAARAGRQQALVWSLAALLFVGMAAIAVALYQRHQPGPARQAAAVQRVASAPAPEANPAVLLKGDGSPTTGTAPAQAPTTALASKGGESPARAAPKPAPKAVRPAEEQRPVAPSPAKPSPEPTPEEAMGLEVPASEENAPAPRPSVEKAGASEAKPAPPETGAPNQPGDAAKQRALERELGRARAALSERDLRAARQHVKAARAHVETPADEARLRRVETLVGDVEEFWKGMSQILASLQPTEEFSIGESMMIVVSADATQVTFRSEGRNTTYALHQIPHEIALTLATSRFARTPTSKALLGAYLAVAPEGDPAAARRLWEEATREGVDMREMMVELGTASGPGSAGNKVAPLTDPARLRKAEQALRAQFPSEYAEVATALKKAELAGKLLKRADTADDPDLRFVMLREAKDLAVAAGRPAAACLAIDQLARDFTIDALAVKAAALEEAAKNVHGPQGHREVAEQALKVAEQAAGARRLEEARRLVSVAAAAAKRSNNLPLVRRVHALGQQLGTEP